MINKFEDYLKEVHAKQYQGLDDDMPDDYEHWLMHLEQEQLIEYADMYTEYRIKKLKEAK